MTKPRTSKPRSKARPAVARPGTSANHDAPLIHLMRAIAAGGPAALDLLKCSPALALASLTTGASRQLAHEWYLTSISHYMNSGDTALHLAAASYHVAMARTLIRQRADLTARNRLGAQPLHYACDGGPDLPSWNPTAQAALIRLLIASGADVQAVDRRGVTPLHRAVRTRCSSAVAALLVGGADPLQCNGSGSTPLALAQGMTGRGGSGSPRAKREQQIIIELLRRHGA